MRGNRPLVVRPTPWAVPPEGMHFEASSADLRQWRLVTDEERATRHCRSSTRERCENEVVAALNRGRNTSSGKVDAWWFYCETHLYGRWIEDGHVMHWRLVKDDAESC